MASELFDKQRKSCFAGLDLSRKGSIDKPIVDLVNFVNGLDNFFTTSSCSGRTLVFEQGDDNQVKKKGCKWLYTSHLTVAAKDVIQSLADMEGNAVFKFEPLVLHIQCRHLEHAQRLHACAVASGLRNSGISIGAKGKIIVAVRSTHSLEVPLSRCGQLLVSHEYLEFLVQCANEKMEENFKRIDRFEENFKNMLQKSLSCDKPCKRISRKDKNRTDRNVSVSSEEAQTRGGNSDTGEAKQPLVTDGDVEHAQEDLDTCFLYEDT